MSQWGSPTAASAGWFADPGGAPHLRYWDGVQWTPHTSQQYQAYGRPAATRIGDNPVARMMLPVGRSGWAIAAGYLGLMGWLLFPLAPFALITAELGRREISRDPQKHGMGRVALGFVGGVIGLAVGIWFIVYQSRN